MGADPNAANRSRSTPIFWAVYDERKVRLLLECGGDINAKLADGRTLVYQAASLGDGLPLLRLLLEKGAQPDVKTLAGMTPLMAAAGHGKVEAMRLLIEKGAVVNAKNSAGATALIAAAAAGSPEAVRLLLEKGADPNVVTKRSQTALAAAATTGVEATVKLLLERGAKVDVEDERGYTALLYAAGSDAVPAGVVRRLLEKGANPELKGDVETARMLAAKRGDTEVSRLLGVPERERARLGGRRRRRKRRRTPDPIGATCAGAAREAELQLHPHRRLQFVSCSGSAFWPLLRWRASGDFGPRADPPVAATDDAVFGGTSDESSGARICQCSHWRRLGPV